MLYGGMNPCPAYATKSLLQHYIYHVESILKILRAIIKYNNHFMPFIVNTPIIYSKVFRLRYGCITIH